MIIGDEKLLHFPVSKYLERPQNLSSVGISIILLSAHTHVHILQPKKLCCISRGASRIRNSMVCFLWNNTQKINWQHPCLKFKSFCLCIFFRRVCPTATDWQLRVDLWDTLIHFAKGLEKIQRQKPNLIVHWVKRIFWLHFECISTAFWLHFDCISTAFRLYFGCILTVFWLHFDCILAAF